MLLVPDTILRSLALGAILVGIVSVLAALTLLPAVLSLLGDHVNSLRIPVIGRRAINSAGSEGRFWSALVGGVMKRPLVSLLAATGLLLALAAPVLSINTGFAGLSTLPDRFPSKQGFVALNRDFPGTGVDPAQIVIQGDVSSAPVRSAIEASPTRTCLAQRRSQCRNSVTSFCSWFRWQATPTRQRRRARSATCVPT
jgi:RND superfamily putative drug exporter